MPAVARLGDLSTGHDGWPARPNNQASPDVFVNGIAVHRQGDSWEIHCKSGADCHDGITSAGSPTVFVNGVAVARVGDPISDGDEIATGSSDVFVN